MPIPAQCQAFWAEAQRAMPGLDEARFYEAFAFGDSEPLARELADLVLRGDKRATASLAWTCEHDGKRPPQAGDLSIVTNWAGEPLALIETTAVERRPFDQVDASFARAEGGGDGSLACWRRNHEAFFGRECARIGRRPSATMPVLCERFRVVYAAAGPTVLRTPDHRFDNLPGWPYAPNYRQHGVYRVHYVDEGPRDAEVTVLCLHGNPSWSYLYRHMIPVFAGQGLRVVAPDLIGFGRSDKPADPGVHGWDLNRGMLLHLVRDLDLRNVLLVVQDWGGLFGLTLPLDEPERYTRALIMNTFFGLGELGDGFRQWRSYSNAQADLPIGRLMQRGKPSMSAAEMLAYDAPFPDASFKAGPKAFPNLVPDVQRDGPNAAPILLSRAAAEFWSQRWNGAALMAVGMADPVLGAGVMRRLHSMIRHCPPPIEIPEAGHFVQEWGAPIAQAALEHFGLIRQAS